MEILNNIEMKIIKKKKELSEIEEKQNYNKLKLSDTYEGYQIAIYDQQYLLFKNDDVVFNGEFDNIDDFFKAISKILKHENDKQIYHELQNDIKSYDNLDIADKRERWDKLTDKNQNLLKKPFTIRQIDLKNKICATLEKNKKPSDKILADYLNSTGKFYRDWDSQQIYYFENGVFEELNTEYLAQFFNEEFGANEININMIQKVLSYITQGIKREYDLILFKNGVLNTRTEEFKENEKLTNCLPKIKLPFDYIENAEDQFKKTALYQEMQDILKTNREGWKNNFNNFILSFGSCAMAVNEKEKVHVLVGIPGSRKTTLLSLFKRCFAYSELKLQTINKNERFQLIPAIGKDINIDDDMQSFQLTNIGVLNTFVSGGGIEVEIKGSNESVKLNAENTPQIIGASNTLPSVIGDGFERRIFLIICENEFKGKKTKKHIIDILNGERDEEIKYLFSYAVQYYFKNKEEMDNEEYNQKMIDEYEWKSYPTKKGAEKLFINAFDLEEIAEEIKDKDIAVGESGKITSIEYIGKQLTIHYDNRKTAIIDCYIEDNDANKHFNKFHKEAYKQGRIFKEQRKPTPKNIKTAMEIEGYQKIRIGTGSERIWIYENAILRKDEEVKPLLEVWERINKNM